MIIDETNLITRLLSGDIETIMDCYDKVVVHIADGGQISLTLKHALLVRFTEGDARDLIAERLSKIATLFETELQVLLTSEISLDAKFWTALLLLHINNKLGVPLLLEVVEARNHSWYLLAAHKLANSNERLVIPAIDRALDHLVHGHIDEIAALLDAMKKLGEPLPLKVLNKFPAENIPWQIKSMFPQGEGAKANGQV